MSRRDLDHDGAGQPFYMPETDQHITDHAERLRITFDEAAAIYEQGVRLRFDALSETPDPEPEPGEFCDKCDASLYLDEVQANPRCGNRDLCNACARADAAANEPT